MWAALNRLPRGQLMGETVSTQEDVIFTVSCQAETRPVSCHRQKRSGKQAKQESNISDAQNSLIHIVVCGQRRHYWDKEQINAEFREWTNASPSSKSNHPIAKTGLTMRHLPICGLLTSGQRLARVLCDRQGSEVCSSKHAECKLQTTASTTGRLMFSLVSSTPQHRSLAKQNTFPNMFWAIWSNWTVKLHIDKNRTNRISG